MKALLSHVKGLMTAPENQLGGWQFGEWVEQGEKGDWSPTDLPVTKGPLGDCCHSFRKR